MRERLAQLCRVLAPVLILGVGVGSITVGLPDSLVLVLLAIGALLYVIASKLDPRRRNPRDP